jgi:hypothetical protein
MKDVVGAYKYRILDEIPDSLQGQSRVGNLYIFIIICGRVFWLKL